MSVLVLNAGSSSLKLQLIDPTTHTSLGKGRVERIGGDARWVGAVEEEVQAPNMESALKIGLQRFREAGILGDLEELGAIGHRVVHGGEDFVQATVITDAVEAGIRSVSHLAPLHNPANLAGIEVARRLAPKVPSVAVFDTAFHHTMPDYAARYAVPQEWYEEYGVRRYGFHGTSHAYVSRRADTLLELGGQGKIVVLHLGNGASGCAVSAGRSVDTTMGMTPVDGLIMGTRTGQLDPAVPLYVMGRAGLSREQVETALNRQSGLKGLCGRNDMREITAAAAAGDAEARLALEAFCYQARLAVGKLAAAMGGLDALVFTGGIGENSGEVRRRIVGGLGFLGLGVAAEAPFAEGLRMDGGPVPVLVLPTNEELEIALQAWALVSPH